jgi:DNA-binding MarR family transcriptional regulator
MLTIDELMQTRHRQGRTVSARDNRDHRANLTKAGKIGRMASKASETRNDSTVTDRSRQDLGWALGTLLRAYLKQTGEVLAELPGGPRGYQVLSLASGTECHNQAAIAEHLGIDRTVMTYLIDGLEAEALVIRTPDPADRRSRQVSLTEKGSETLATLSARVDRVEHALLAELSDAESEQLRSLLGRAAVIVGADQGGRDACETAEALRDEPELEASLRLSR